MLNIKDVILGVIFIFFGYSDSLFSVYVENKQQMNSLSYNPGQLLVKTIQGAPADVLDDVAYALDAVLVMDFPLVPGLALYSYDGSLPLRDVIRAFLESGQVEYAEPDFYYYAATQNDPRFHEQWALENTGQTGGKVDADINATSMWDITNGNQAVVIGVIDTGVDYTHADLVANLWRNPLEVPANGVDDDHNGYVDDIFGLNAVTDSGNPLDDNAHGTHVTGTIGADGNNLVGIVGVTQNVQIAHCKFLAANGSGLTSDAIQCLQYFANLKTRIINPLNIIATNNSWGSTSNSSSLQDAIKVHQNLGILFIAAAGNAASNNDLTPNFPSNYDLANIIAVAATDQNDVLASFSNYGKRTVHVGAPGVRILSTVLNQSYALFSGTSMATPHVTGLVAEIKSAFPLLDYHQIKNLVLASGTPLSVLQNTVSGRRIRGADTLGRGALTCINQQVSTRLQPIANSINLSLGNSIFLSALRINCTLPASPPVLYSSGGETVVLQDSGLNGDKVATDGVYSLLWRPLRAQTYILDYGNGDVVNINVTGGALPSAYQASSVPFEYENITGTSLGAGDETIHKVIPPFPIHFNANAAGYTSLYVGSNGTMSFTTTTNPGYLNHPFPVSSIGTSLSPYWDDLVPNGAASNIYVATTGISPNRHFVVEWRNIKNFNATGSGTFQSIFFESSADVHFNYLDTNFGNTATNFGASATVGVQTSSTTATEVSFDVPSVPSPHSLVFRLQ